VVSFLVYQASLICHHQASAIGVAGVDFNNALANTGLSLSNCSSISLSSFSGAKDENFSHFCIPAFFIKSFA
jgi:hypothetical protein